MSNSYYPVAGQGTPEFRPASVPNNWIWNPTQMAWVDPNDPTGALFGWTLQADGSYMYDPRVQAGNAYHDCRKGICIY